MNAMTDTTNNAPKNKAKEAPKFEAPKFDIPTVEVPAAFREFAEKGLAQAKQNYEKLKTVAEDATDAIETSYSNASKGASEYGLAVIANSRTNTNAAFDLLGALMGAKSYAEVVELSSGFARQQFETLTAQAKELNAVAQKAGTETFEPIKEGFSSAVKKAA
jgi:phasin